MNVVGGIIMDVTLTDVEVRVLGCLIEKAVTTPEYYPLTLNSLTTACNQKSNRDPVMALDDKTVVRAIDALRYDYHIVWYFKVNICPSFCRIWSILFQ